jgi:hypothetical protein
MNPLVIGLTAAALCLVAGVSRPGWTARPGQALRRAVALALGAATLLGAVALGLALDDRVRGAALAWALPRAPHLLAPLGTWLRGPGLTGVLLGAVAIGAVLAVDVLAPGSLEPVRIGRRVARAAARLRRATPYLFSLFLLLLGWADVLLATGGVPGRRVLEALGGGAALGDGPDLRVTAVAWWLAAGLICVSQARRIRLLDSRRPGRDPSRDPARWPGRDLLRNPGGQRLWLLAPPLAGLLAVVARPVAVAVAVPAFVLAGAAALLLTRRAARREDGAPDATATPVRLLERILLLAILCLALTLRWTPAMTNPLGPDAGGYFAMAQQFHERVRAEGTNPIALAYLNIHPASREPLFILLLRGVFDLSATSPCWPRWAASP